jgi:tetratricopeptide (TPR) repeat protein
MSSNSLLSESASNVTLVLDAESYKDEGNRRLKNYNDISGAIQAYSKAIILSKSNHLYYINRAVAYLLLEEYDNCISDCDASLDLCKNVKAYCRKASALGKMGKTNQAVTIILKALDMDSKDKESSIVLETLVIDKGKGKHRAEEEDDSPQGKANKLQNENLIKKRASDLCKEGNSLVRKNNFKDGVACFTKAIILCPAAHKYYFLRAMAHKLNGDYKKALLDCDSSWKLHDNIAAYNLKASILSNKKKYDDALDCVMKCLEIDPENEESIKLHETISKDRLSRNRSPTIGLIEKQKVRQKTAKIKTEPSFMMKKLGSPKSNKDVDVPWHQLPVKHTRNEVSIKRGNVRIVDRFEWDDLPVEYSYRKNHSHRKAKPVRMKQIPKIEKMSPIKAYCTNIYILIVGSVQRLLSTEASRKASVSPTLTRRSRNGNGLTQVGI